MRGVFASCAIAALVLAVTLAFPEPHHHGHSHDGHSHDGHGHSHSHDGHGHSHSHDGHGHSHSHDGHSGHSHGINHSSSHDYHHGLDEKFNHTGDTTGHKLVPFINYFSLNVYANLIKLSPAPKNIIWSPVTIANAVSMLLDGTSGATFSQIYNVFNYTDLTLSQIFQAYEHINHMLVFHQNGQVLYGSILVVCSDTVPNKHFLEDIRHFFNGVVLKVDCSNTQTAVQEINSVIATNTLSKITNMVKTFTPDTSMLLLSYTYFRGQWVHPFNPVLTTTGDFIVDATKTVQVSMMYKSMSIDYLRDDVNHATVISLPFNYHDTMIVILPDEGEMEAIVAKVKLDLIPRSIALFKKQLVELRLPKMSISYGFSMTDMLKAMGMTKAFSKTAQFNELSSTPNLHLTEVKHFVQLVVDETGLDSPGAGDEEISDHEAATLLPGSSNISMTVNRPFLVFIRNEDTKTNIFIGKITDPTAN